MYQFAYSAPESIDEAVRLLAEDEDALPLSGGMTLLPTMKQRLRQPTQLVDLGRIPFLRRVEREGDRLFVGGMTRHADVASSQAVRDFCPALCDLAAHIGDPQVRNRGTIGGSVANNDPAADYPAALLALDATVVTDRREIQGEEFFTGMFSTALEAGEIITGVRFSRPDQAAYSKFRHPASRYAVAGVFVARTGPRIRVGVTGAAPFAFRWREAEDALQRDFSIDALEGVRLSADRLNEDIHANAAYRAHLAGVMLRRALMSITAA